MVTDLVLELDYPFLHISTFEDVYINSALYKCFFLTYLLTYFLFNTGAGAFSFVSAMGTVSVGIEPHH